MERDFKARCVQILRLAPGIRKAFLVRATLVGASEPGIVLVLVARDSPDPALLTTTRDLATTLLGADPPVTVITLHPGGCAPLERVCSAFYYAV